MNNSFVITLICLVAVAGDVARGETGRIEGVYKDEFRVGAAISNGQIDGEEPAALALAARQYNTITAENRLKWALVHPRPHEYNFAPADRYVAFGEKHGMFIVGHTLIWHHQTPGWVFEDDRGEPVDRETLLGRMRDHIHAVVGRYKGRVHGWDVVNEAIEDDGTLRKSKWLEIIGPDYLDKAFQFAHEADPDAELYYNDYDEWKTGKRGGGGGAARAAPEVGGHPHRRRRHAGALGLRLSDAR